MRRRVQPADRNVLPILFPTLVQASSQRSDLGAQIRDQRPRVLLRANTVGNVDLRPVQAHRLVLRIAFDGTAYKNEDHTAVGPPYAPFALKFAIFERPLDLLCRVRQVVRIQSS